MRMFDHGSAQETFEMHQHNMHLERVRVLQQLREQRQQQFSARAIHRVQHTYTAIGSAATIQQYGGPLPATPQPGLPTKGQGESPRTVGQHPAVSRIAGAAQGGRKI